MDDGNKDQFDGFAVLEEAALSMLGATDEAAALETYREHLNRLLLENLGDPSLAQAVANKLLDIIAQRRKEIEMSAGASRTEVIQ
jgi:hypothetical protein